MRYKDVTCKLILIISNYTDVTRTKWRQGQRALPWPPQ